MTACRTCGQPLLFALSERGRRMPLDPNPYQGDQPDRLFVLRNRNKMIPTALAVTPDAFPDEPVYRSHDCPDKRQRRRR